MYMNASNIYLTLDIENTIMLFIILLASLLCAKGEAFEIKKEVLEKRKLQDLFDKSSPGEYIFYDDLMDFVEDFFVSEDDEKMIGQHYIYGNVTILKILLRVTKTYYWEIHIKLWNHSQEKPSNETKTKEEFKEFVDDQKPFVLSDLEEILSLSSLANTSYKLYIDLKSNHDQESK